MNKIMKMMKVVMCEKWRRAAGERISSVGVLYPARMVELPPWGKLLLPW